jgi:hypothetical protein
MLTVGWFRFRSRWVARRQYNESTISVVKLYFKNLLLQVSFIKLLALVLRSAIPENRSIWFFHSGSFPATKMATELHSPKVSVLQKTDNFNTSSYDINSSGGIGASIKAFRPRPAQETTPVAKNAMASKYQVRLPDVKFIFALSSKIKNSLSGQ